MEQLIKGKWYKITTFKDYCLYFKIGEINKTSVYFYNRDYISNEKFNKADCIDIKDIKHYNLINISEIAHLLPKNHPDLQNKIYELW
jgi:hypothetical protein